MTVTHDDDAHRRLVDAIDDMDRCDSRDDQVSGILDELTGHGLVIVAAGRVLATDAEIIAAEFAQLKLDVRTIAEAIYDQQMTRAYVGDKLNPIMDRYRR